MSSSFLYVAALPRAHQEITVKIITKRYIFDLWHFTVNISSYNNTIAVEKKLTQKNSFI